MFVVKIVREIKGKLVNSFWCGFDKGFGAAHFAVKCETQDEINLERDLAWDWIAAIDVEDENERCRVMAERNNFEEIVIEQNI